MLVLDEAGRVLVDESNQSLAANGFGVNRASPEVTEPETPEPDVSPEDSSKGLINRRADERKLCMKGAKA